MLFNQRMLAVLLMGFASGLPIVLIGTTLQAWFTVSGISIVTIGALSLVGQPYIYKFLWAPLMDRFSLFGLGRRRGWIVLMQLCLVVLLVVMAWLQPQIHPWYIAAVALMIACCSASQDIAIDAYRADISLPQERGVAAALVTIGYRGAMLVAGAIALIIANWQGWRVMYCIMAGLLAIEILITLWAPRPNKQQQTTPTTIYQSVVAPWQQLLKRDYAWGILLFIAIYHLCDAYALSLNTAFLLRAMDFSLAQVGAISKVAGLSGSLVGGLIGGLLLPYVGLYRSLLWFGLLQMLSNLLYYAMAVAFKGVAFMAVAMFAEYFCGGLVTVASVALLMGLCDQRYSATQYALLSALAALARVFVGPSAGVLVLHLGWANFYLFSVLVGLPGLALLCWLRHRFDFSGLEVMVR